MPSRKCGEIDATSDQCDPRTMVEPKRLFQNRSCHEYPEYGGQIDHVAGLGSPDAPHSFCDETRPESFNAAACTNAWKEVTRFLRQQL